MPEIKLPKSIRQLFLELPEKVRDWLTSERVTYTIIEINKKLDLFGNLLTVIPNLITKLVTKNLDPKDFTKELEDGLGLDSEQAQQVTQEIVSKILRPIDLPLKETGVFIGLIYALPSEALAKGGATTPSAPTPTSTQPTPPAPPRPQPPVLPSPAPQVPPIVKIPINVTTPKPPLPPIPPRPSPSAPSDAKALEGKTEGKPKPPTI